MVRPVWPVFGSISVRELLYTLPTYRWRMSHDGEMCCGSAPTVSVRITLKVFGSITLTVPVSLLGTYTRVGIPRTAGASVRDVMPAYTLLCRGHGRRGLTERR